MADLQQLVAEQRQLEEELDIQHMVAEQKRLEEDKVDTNPSGCDTPTIAKVVMATPNRGPVFVLDSTYKAVNKYKLADSAAPTAVRQPLPGGRRQAHSGLHRVQLQQEAQHYVQF